MGPHQFSHSSWETLVGKGFQAASWYGAAGEGWAAPHLHPYPRAGQPDADAGAQGQAGGCQGSQTLCSTMGLRNMEVAPALPRESSGKLGLPAYSWGAPRPGCPCFRPWPCSRVASLLGPQLSACQPRSCPTLNLQVGASPSATCPAPGCPSRTTSATSPCSPDPRPLPAPPPLN